MRRAKYIICMILAVNAVSLAGQSRSDMRELFVSAEGDMLFEDYPEALPKYLSLLQIFPDNYNLYYRIGQCYLNTPGEKNESIPWLETAAGHINPSYRNGRLRETGAPYDVLYLLANAYRIANDFDRALQTYELFLKDVDTEKYDTALVRFQMQTCDNARIMMRKPVSVVDRNLGNIINDRFSEFNPVISADEKTLIFTRELQFYDAIFWSRKINGKWTEPVNLTPQLGVDQDYYTSSLSPDGRTLLMYRTDKYDGNIYMSSLQGDTWSEVEKLNGNINTRFWESHATISSDGKKIFFTSNRKESLGGLDIFVSVRDSSGNWGPAVNIGPEINTVYNEETPFLARNDSTLFFSSRGHFNLGGYDIFRSDLDANGKWSKPVNVGYPLNTADDDLFFTPVGTGNRGYHARFADDGFGRMDLFSCDIYSDLNPRNFFVTGRAAVNNLIDEFPQPVKVTAVNASDTGKTISALTNPGTGLYGLLLPHGTYNISFDSEKAITESREIRLSPDRETDTVTIQPVNLEETDFSAYLRLLSDTLLEVNGPDPALIELITEERSLLDIEVLSPDSLVVSEQYRITDTAFTYTFMPERGDSRVSVLLTDRFGNDTVTAITVRRTDSRTRKVKPLYHEIPERPAGERATAMKSAGTDNSEATGAANTAGTTVTEGKSDPGERALRPAADSAQETVTEGKESCNWWWLLIAAVLLIFLFLWKRKKDKRKETEQ
jgi:tetratricopeptide (TPR) repeat protein